MASSEETLSETFRILLHRIAIQLTPQNCHGLKFLLSYSKRSTEQNILGLDILDELLTREAISPMKPDRLEKLLSEINRQDLVDLIKEYKKRDKFKSAQKQASKKAGKKLSVKRSPGNDDMLPSTLLTAAHLNSHMWSLVDTATRTRVMCKRETAAIAEVRRDNEKLRKSLKKAIVLMTERKITEERTIALGINPSALGMNPSGVMMNPSAVKLPAQSKLDKNRAVLSISTPNLVHSSAPQLASERRGSAYSSRDGPTWVSLADQAPYTGENGFITLNTAVPALKVNSEDIVEEEPDYEYLDDSDYTDMM